MNEIVENNRTLLQKSTFPFFMRPSTSHRAVVRSEDPTPPRDLLWKFPCLSRLSLKFPLYEALTFLQISSKYYEG